MKPLASMFLILAMLAITPGLIAQNEVSYTRGTTQSESILPPSPEAASAVKYAGVPFTHSMGAAEYDVPLYEIKGRELTIPVSLSYRSNGIRVDEIAGVAGLGWNLNAGGCVTREVVYMPDEYANWYFYNRPTGQLLSDLEDHEWNSQTSIFVGHTMHHLHDPGADRYSYNVNGISGTFIITPEREIIQLTGDGVRIEKTHSGGMLNGPISSFRIIGPDGTNYVFSDCEVSTRKNQKVVPEPIGSGPDISWSATTAWYLTSITSADNTEQAVLTYADGGVWDRSIRDYSKGMTIHTKGAYLDMDQPTEFYTGGGFVESTCSTRVLSSIALRGTVMDFEYFSQNTSTLHKAGQRTPLNNHPRRLSWITVTSPEDSLLVSYGIHTVRASKDGRIILAGIDQYHGEDITDSWNFTYKTLDHEIYRYSQDWFGFYNKENLDDQQIAIIQNPGGENPNPDNGYVNLNPSVPLGPGFDDPPGGSGSGGGQNTPDYRPRGNLSPYKIENRLPVGTIQLEFGYPVSEQADYMSLLVADHDGAKTVFEYEGAFASNDINHDITIGVRVKSIGIYDGPNLAQLRTFAYSSPAVDGNWYPEYCDYVTLSVTESSLNYQPVATWDYSVHEGSVSPGSSLSSSRVMYGMVTEKVLPTNQDTLGVKTIFHYDTSLSTSIEYSVAINVPHYADSVLTNQMTGNPSLTLRNGYIANENPLPALLTRKESYRVNADNQEELYESEDYTYKNFGQEAVCVDYSATELVANANQPGVISPNRIHHFPVYAKKIYGAAPSTVVKVGYHSSGNDTTVVSYGYVSRHDLEKPIRKASVRISGSDALRRVNYEYADTTSMTGAWISSLARRHSIDEPIRQSYLMIVGADTTYRLDRETEYDFFTTGGNTRLQQKNNRERINGVESWNETILSRDGNGNITAIKERGKPLMQIQWGYGGLYPVSVTQGSGSTILTSTYEWAPGIGLLRETQPNGVSVYYEYDNAGRLHRIKNTSGKTKEKYEYGLKNDGSNRRQVRHITYLKSNGVVHTEEKTWWNTLGLKQQVVEKDASGNGNALVSAYGSDYLLHDDVMSWLPFPTNYANGAFVNNAPSAAIAYHQSLGAYSFKGYEQSGRDKEVSSSFPDYHDYQNTMSDDVRAGYPHYVWTDNGVEQDGSYLSNEIITDIVTDADGRVWTKVKDHFGNILGTTYGQGVISSTYIYDRLGRLRAVAGGAIALTDTLNMWRYSYDSIGRVSSKGIPGSSRESYVYDDEDRVITIIKEGEVLETEYDALGRVTARYLTNFGHRNVIEQNWYDGRPNDANVLLSIITPAISGAISQCGLSGMKTYSKQAVFDEDGAINGYEFSAYTYDSEGRPIMTAHMRTGETTECYSEENRYDFLGNTTKKAYTTGLPNRGRDVMLVNTTFDKRSRPVRKISVLNTRTNVTLRDTTDFAYDDLGRLWKVSSSSGGAIQLSENAYTLQGFLSNMSYKINGNVLFSEGLCYENPALNDFPGSHAGLITRINTTWAGPYDQMGVALLYPSTIGYKYDAAGRVVIAAGFEGATLGSPTINGEQFSYDNSGNITFRGRYLDNALDETPVRFYYNGHKLIRYQISRYNPHHNPPLPDLNYYFTHDNRGRMVSDGLQDMHFSYNHMDLPTKVSRNDTLLVKYSYLADGTKVSALGADGIGLVYCGPMVYRRAATGARSFESVAIDAGRMKADGVRYHVTDHLGSVVGVVRGSDGAVLECKAYGVYGNLSDGPRNVSSTTEQFRYHFSGKEDQSSEFSIPYTDFGARLYSTDIRRWLVPDPKSEDYYSISPYAYCAGDPVNLVDPDGLSTDDFLFNSKGLMVERIKTDEEDRIIMAQENGPDIVARFADPVNDPQSLKPGVSRIRIQSDKTINDALKQSGALKEENHGLLKGIMYLREESDSSKGDGRLDFTGSGNYGVFDNDCLYLTHTKHDGYVAHNAFNYGNFLWGAAASALGVPLFIARTGAHINNFIDRHYFGTFDSKDDQFSISVGFRWYYEKKE